MTAFDNVPFPATIVDPELLEYAAKLDARNPPVVDSLVGTIHYGGMPAGRILTALVVFEAVTIAAIIGIAVFAYRAAIDSQRDRVWVGMAREAAHQLGTPLMSLHGWIETLRTRPTPPPGLADHLLADTERLDRVAQRFERIGNAPRTFRLPPGEGGRRPDEGSAGPETSLLPLTIFRGRRRHADHSHSHTTNGPHYRGPPRAGSQ